jgi:two-component system phosphate regulon sensor histidine kinase PhoR
MSTTSAQAPYGDAALAPHRPVPWWGWLLAAALLFAAGVSGAAFAPPGSGLAVWWPAAGIALAFALLQPVARIPLAVALVLVTITAANAVVGRPLPLALALGTANTVEVLIALGVLQAWRRTVRLSSLRAALRFAGAASIAAMAAGVLAGLAFTILGGGELWPTVPFVAASHAAALLTIAPFAALPPRVPVRAGAVEMAVQATLLVLAIGFVFHPDTSLPLAFTLYPFLAWAAFRFPIRLVLLETLVASVAMLVLTLVGGGPFRAESIDVIAGAALLEVLLVTFAGFGLVLCAAQYELRAISRQLDATTLLLGGSLVDARIGLAIAQRRTDGTRVVWSNRAARVLLAAELGHRDAWAGRIQEAAARALHSAEQTSVTTVGGRSITVAANAIEGDDDRFAVQLLDVTSILQAQQAQVEAEVERESARTIRAELERQRDDFLATTSHELRTPITSIVGYTELLAESDAVPASKRGWLDVIDRNAHRLAELVEDLLTLSGGATAPTRPQHLDVLTGVEVLEEVVANLRVVSDPKRLRVSIAPGDVAVLGARSDVLRAITNLLTNAIKFTPEGGRIRLAASEDDGMALLAVADTGPGMSEEELEQAFERFYRAPSAERDNVAGTGLGLAIVAELARRNGGDVALVRNDEGGLTAELRLPLPA